MWPTASSPASCISAAPISFGVPFNIASYALLTLMVAQVCQLQPGEFIHTRATPICDNSNHLEQAQLQLSREPRPLPVMRLNPRRHRPVHLQI